MKYSIRGNMNTTDGTAIVDTLNSCSLWRLITSADETFSFEAWVNSSGDKDALFTALKPFVDDNGGSVDWHECTHDEPDPRPCIIAETYARG